MLAQEFVAKALHLDRKRDRKSTRLNSSHSQISYAVFCLKKKRVRLHRSLPPPARPPYVRLPRLSFVPAPRLARNPPPPVRHNAGALSCRPCHTLPRCTPG